MYWVVRESIRKALERGRMKFDSREELVDAARKISQSRYKFDNIGIFGESKLLRERRSQKNLEEWF